MPLRFFLPFLLGLAATAAASMACAQYPDKPVRIIVPYPAAGIADTVARVVGEKLSQRWKQPVIVDNKPGATGVIAMRALMASPPDGYTLAVHATAGLTMHPATAKTPAYDTLRDLTPIAPLASSMLVLVASPSVPVGTVAELIEYARRNPGKLSYGSAGIGAMNHVGAELFKIRTGVDLTHVPYKGDAPVVADLLNGNVSISFLSSSLAIPQIRSGKLKGLAVTSRGRADAIPDLPSMQEAGVKEFVLRPWNGMVGPAGLPRPLVDHLNKTLGEVMMQADVRQRLAPLGLVPEVAMAADFAKSIGAEIDMWRGVVKAANIRVE